MQKDMNQFILMERQALEPEEEPEKGYLCAGCDDAEDGWL